jgi:hypothetical protein
MIEIRMMHGPKSINAIKWLFAHLCQHVHREGENERSRDRLVAFSVFTPRLIWPHGRMLLPVCLAIYVEYRGKNPFCANSTSPCDYDTAIETINSDGPVIIP